MTVENKKIKGMLVFVYRNADSYDCTNGGMSSKVNQFVVVGEGLPEIFSPSSRAPLAYLFPGHVKNSWRIVPDDARNTEKMCGPMAGGNFAGTSDGRWHSIVGSELVSIHDRWEDYNNS